MANRQSRHHHCSNRSRVLIGETAPIMREGLIHLINQEPDLWVCGEQDDSRGVVEAVLDLEPNLVLLELVLPGSSGLELIRTLHRHAPQVAILILSRYDETLYALRALRAGAQGYLSKRVAPPVLLGGIHKVLNGHIVVSGHLATQFIQHTMSGEVPLDSSWAASLTDREIEVLHCIGEGWSMREIGHAFHLSFKTVETYRRHLIKKLQLADASALFHYAVCWTAAIHQ